MKNEAKSHPKKAVTTTAETTETVGDQQIIDDVNTGRTKGEQAIETLISLIRSRRIQGQDDRLKDGELFHLLRKTCDPYKKAETGLTYTQSVAKTGVPRPTAEHLRQMYETQQAYTVPGDTFLMLCGEGVNLADIKEKGTRFEALVKTWLPRIRDLDITDETAFARSVAEIKAAIEKEDPKEESLADLEEDFKKLREDLRKAKNENEIESLAKDIEVAREKIGKFYVRRMKALLDGLAPFFGWDTSQVKERIKKFEAEQPTLRVKRYNEALNYINSIRKNIEPLFSVGAKEEAAA
jgi:hypothetical protein